NAGLLERVTLGREVNGGPSQPVRVAEYAYYGEGEPFGNPGDLKTATVRDGLGAALGTSYYRYYLPGQTGGYAGGLKYAFGPEAFARLQAEVGDPFTASDAAVAPYAEHYFEYDADQRVT